MPPNDPMDLAAQFAALNTATRRINEAITDARTERQLLVQARKELNELLDEAKRDLSAIALDAATHYLIGYLETLGPTVRAEMDQAIAATSATFSAELAAECSRLIAEMKRLHA